MKICTITGGPCPAFCGLGVDTTEIEKLLTERPSIKSTELWLRFKRLLDQLMANGGELIESVMLHGGEPRSRSEILASQRQIGTQLRQLQDEIRYELRNPDCPENRSFALPQVNLGDLRYQAHDVPPRINRALIISVQSRGKPVNQIPHFLDRIVLFTRAGAHSPKSRKRHRVKVKIRRSRKGPKFEQVVLTVAS